MSIIEEAVAFLRLADEAESTNRAEGLADLQFVSGDQWPVDMMNSRQLENRPCLTINKIDAFCRQISNQQRQQRPRIKIHPTNTEADKKVADVITGLTRHIEQNSNADTAYDTAFDHAVKMGWGYWRVRTGYTREDSFDQDIFIDPIDNPFTVYFDPASNLPDGSDAERCMVTRMIQKDIFRRQYPNADDGGQFLARGTGDVNKEWISKDEIRIAEFYKVVRTKSALIKMSDGKTYWEDELPSEETLMLSGLMEVTRRTSYKREVKWWKVTSLGVLEEAKWPGRWIPIVPVYGNEVVINGKKKRFGLVRYGKDPQKMVNYWETAATESIALAPKAKWMLAEGQDEGHENEWARANQSANPVLRYKQNDIAGQPAPPPQRLQPEPPPVGILQALQIATTNMREVLGVVDPSMQITGNVSGKALNAEKMQSDNANFHFYDNLTRSIQHTGRIILDLIPRIYDVQRVTRIIGDDGRPDLITVNNRKTTPEGEVIENNVQVGEYDVVMDIGPGYNSKRIEAVEAMTPLMANPQIMQVIGDLYFRNSDFPGADVIADRLAAMNPLAQIDDKSEIPPKVQMMIKQLQTQLQQLQQQNQQQAMLLKNRMDVEQVRQQGETQREHMRATVKAHDIETWSAVDREKAEIQTHTKAHDTVLNNETAKDIEFIKGQFALLLAKIDASARRGAAIETEERAI